MYLRGYKFWTQNSLHTRRTNCKRSQFTFKNKKKPKTKLGKRKTKTNFFEIFSFSKKQPKQLFEITKMLLKFQKIEKRAQGVFSSYKLENEWKLEQKDFNLYKTTQIAAKSLTNWPRSQERNTSKFVKKTFKKQEKLWGHKNMESKASRCEIQAWHWNWKQFHVLED